MAANLDLIFQGEEADGDLEADVSHLENYDYSPADEDDLRKRIRHQGRHLCSETRP